MSRVGNFHFKIEKGSFLLKNLNFEFRAKIVNKFWEKATTIFRRKKNEVGIWKRRIEGFTFSTFSFQIKVLQYLCKK